VFCYRDGGMHVFRKTRVWVAGAAAACFGLAACGSSGSGTGGNSGSGGGKQASKSEIAIGTIGSYTNPGSTIGPSRSVIENWVSDVNAGGGLDGHKVKLVVKDDGLSPATALTAAKDLITQSHVVAIVSEISLLDSVWAPYAASAGVPVIGGQPFGNPMATNKDFFPSGTNSIARTWGELNEAKHAYGSKFGVLYCAEAPVCKTGSDIFNKLAPGLGMTIPVDDSITATAPNYTAQCQKLKTANPGAMAIGHGSPIALRVIAQCAQQGVGAKPVSTGGIADATFLGATGTDGLINIDLNFPYFADTTPATKAYQAFQTQHGLKNASGASGTYVWAGLQLFKKAVDTVGSGAVTSDSLKKALYGVNGETLGGLAPPLTFKKDGTTQINCYFVDKISNGKWTLPYDLKPQCAPDSAVTGALGILK